MGKLKVTFIFYTVSKVIENYYLLAACFEPHSTISSTKTMPYSANLLKSPITFNNTSRKMWLGL